MWNLQLNLDTKFIVEKSLKWSLLTGDLYKKGCSKLNKSSGEHKWQAKETVPSGGLRYRFDLTVERIWTLKSVSYYQVKN